jgi:hypothetical protein
MRMIATLCAGTLIGCGATAPRRPMQLHRVVLYQNGIGHFERTGHVTGETLGLEFGRGELDDVLKTLTVIDRLGAAVLAVRATALVARTVIAGQERTPQARPTVRVAGGQTRRDLAADRRDYAFEIAASNPTGSEWRCQSPTLRVTYRTRANFLGAVDLPGDAIAIPAGQTATTTLRFTTSNVIPRHCRVDAYTLIFVDASGERSVADASLPSVTQADTDGTGSPTWGWD